MRFTITLALLLLCGHANATLKVVELRTPVTFTLGNVTDKEIGRKFLHVPTPVGTVAVFYGISTNYYPSGDRNGMHLLEQLDGYLGSDFDSGAVYNVVSKIHGASAARSINCFLIQDSVSLKKFANGKSFKAAETASRTQYSGGVVFYPLIQNGLPGNLFIGVENQLSEPVSVTIETVAVVDIDSLHLERPPQAQSTDKSTRNLMMPSFLGNVNEYMNKNIRYPKDARKNEFEGRVIVKFAVDTNGSITDILSTKAGYGLEEEARRVIRSMPPWKPGTKDGKAVKVYFTIPVRFKLE